MREWENEKRKTQINIMVENGMRELSQKWMVSDSTNVLLPSERTQTCFCVFNPNWIDNNEKLNDRTNDKLSHLVMCCFILYKIRPSFLSIFFFVFFFPSKGNWVWYFYQTNRFWIARTFLIWIVLICLVIISHTFSITMLRRFINTGLGQYFAKRTMCCQPSTNNHSLSMACFILKRKFSMFYSSIVMYFKILLISSNNKYISNYFICHKLRVCVRAMVFNFGRLVF